MPRFSDSCHSCRLAVKYFFMTNDGTNSDADLVINPFNAVEEQNDYEVRDRHATLWEAMQM